MTVLRWVLGVIGAGVVLTMVMFLTWMLCVLTGARP